DTAERACLRVSEVSDGLPPLLLSPDLDLLLFDLREQRSDSVGNSCLDDLRVEHVRRLKSNQLTLDDFRRGGLQGRVRDRRGSVDLTPAEGVLPETLRDVLDADSPLSPHVGRCVSRLPRHAVADTGAGLVKSHGPRHDLLPELLQHLLAALG